MNEVHGLNLHHLEIFHRVVQEGNLSRAGEVLGVSQPAVSKQLRELEERLGIELLERMARGVRPTEAGAELDRHATELFAVRDRALAAMRDRVQGRAGRILAGASRTIGTYLLPALLARHRKVRPEVELGASIGNTAQVEKWLEEGSIDVGLVEGMPSPSLEQGVFGGDDLVPVGAPSLVGSAPRATLAEFCLHPLVLREPGSGSRELVERVLASRRVEPRRFASFDSTESVREFAEAGLGVAFLPRAAAEASLERGTLVEVVLSDVRLAREYRWILWPGRPRSPAVSGFLRLVSEPVGVGN